MPRIENTSSSRSRSRSPPPPPPARRRRYRSPGEEERRGRRRETSPALTASQEARIQAILREREEPLQQHNALQAAPPVAPPAAPPTGPPALVGPSTVPPAAGYPVALPGANNRGGNFRGRGYRGRGRARAIQVTRAVELYIPGPDIPICRRHLTPMCHRCLFFNRPE